MKPEKKYLIAYFSHSGNTEIAAKMTAELTGGKLNEKVICGTKIAGGRTARYWMVKQSLYPILKAAFTTALYVGDY